MIYTVAAYYDVETEKYNPPMLFPFPVDNVIETIKEATIKGKIEGAEAFELYQLGNYDTADASFELLAKPVKLLKLKDFVRVKEGA